MRRVYILPLTEMETGPSLERAWGKVDSARKEKALRCRNHQDKLRSLAAGLLLQYITEKQEMTEEGIAEGGFPVSQESTQWIVLDLQKVLEKIGNPKELPFIYGRYGKPYFAEGYSELHFSLSHSGSYVVCAVSQQEIGADIQKIIVKDYKKLAVRFFMEEECRALEELCTPQERELFFCRLWTRKEAYGKLRGDGLLSGMKINTAACSSDEIKWEDFNERKGYGISICYYM